MRAILHAYLPTEVLTCDSLCPCQKQTSERIYERGAWGRALRLGRLCVHGLVETCPGCRERDVTM